MNTTSLSTQHFFLQDGGEAGELIRTIAWEITPLGDPGTWPLVLRHAVRFMLDSPLPMYIAWGPELVMLYNDGYIPTLGPVRHPLVMGKPLRQSSPHVYESISPLYAQVMQGEKIHRKDFAIVLNKAGRDERCFFDLSYVPIYLDNGSIGGLQAVFIETTEKVRAIKNLEEVNNELSFAIDATELGVWDLNPTTNRFAGNARLKDWFGLKPEDEIPLPLALNVIAETDRQRVTDAIQQALVYSSGGHYDIEYTIIHPVTNKTRIVRAKGRAWFGEDQMPYRFNGTLQDITERATARQRTLESEARFRSLIEEAPVPTALFVGRNLVIEVANKPVLDVWGKGDSIIGKPLGKALPELEGQPFLKILDDIFTTGETFETKNTPADLVVDGVMGRYYFDYTFKPLRNAAGEVYAIMDMAIDVTEQVLARQKIEESNQQIRSLVESAPFPIGVYTGREMRIQLANQTILDIWGKGNDVIGKLYADILPELENQEIYQQLDAVYTTGLAFHAKNQRVDLLINGALQIFYFNYSFTPLFNAAGEVYGVMNTAAEVTDLNLAKQEVEKGEAALRNAIELAELATWSLNVKNNTFTYSPRFMQWLGFTEDTKDLAAAYNPLPDEYRQSVPAVVNEVLKPGSTGIYDNEHPIVNRLTGQVRIIHAQAQVFRNAAGEAETLSGLAQDVTKERKLQQALEFQVQERTEELHAVNEELHASNEELEQANNALQQNNRELEQFAYIASHDLQEPLRKVSTFTEMLKTSLGEVDTRSQTYLDKITSSTARMLQLIKDVLNFSQLSESRDVFVPVNLNAIVNNIVSDFELLIQQKGAVVHYTGLLTIKAIPLQMQQLFGNLISNALKFTRPNVPPVITISSSFITENEKHPALLPGILYYILQIDDNGIGFEQEYAQQIFGIFQRLHGRTEYAGTGIGLALCKKIAQNHGGDIWAESAEGSGATFKIALPVKQGQV